MSESAPLLSSFQGASDEFPSVLEGKKVLLATESWGPVNGVSRTTRSLVEYLQAHGVDLILVAPDFKGDAAKQTQSWERRLPGCALPYNPDLTVVYPFHIGDVYRQAFKPDIIYLASPASLGFQMLLQIRQLRSSPPVLLNFQTDLSAYSEIMLPAPLDRFGVWLLGIVQGFLFRSPAVHTIFYPCSAIRGYLEHVGAPTNRMVQLGRGVDTVLFTPDQRDEAYRQQIAPNGEKILICVCRIAPEKGFEFLAQVAIRLAAEKIPFKLLIVGGESQPGRRKQSQATIPDLFLHCSVTETFGLVVLEAMASGIPVIARDQGGPSDIIRHGQTGFLVPPQDVDQFTKLTREVSKNTSHRKKLSTAARQQAEDTTWEKINRRAAWQIAEALTNADQESHSPSRQPRTGILAWVIEQVCLVLAVGVVYGMWLIAVVPLIVHGHRFLPRAWQALRNQFQCSRPLRK
ncbi:hypothetical protein N7494_010321 [Penicillium frequentans]|uniref:GDP-mannose-dependent alpha-mannosyltransferase n=1 Tax=Penicillium frequentans TaxID=3151616 RepID=A0AAD6G859_9EURO|nr:hypothetical protein N7494_010321 [Penicillium glabrum]